MASSDNFSSTDLHSVVKSLIIKLLIAPFGRLDGGKNGAGQAGFFPFLCITLKDYLAGAEKQGCQSKNRVAHNDTVKEAQEPCSQL